jgi:hypothetical protein
VSPGFDLAQVKISGIDADIAALKKTRQYLDAEIEPEGKKEKRRHQRLELRAEVTVRSESGVLPGRDWRFFRRLSRFSDR